jgi:hypothetical protein
MSSELAVGLDVRQIFPAEAALPVWEAQSLSLDEAIRIAPIEDFHGAIPLAILRKVILRRDYSQKALHLAQPR